MSNYSSVIFGFIFAAMLIYITAKGSLRNYIGFLLG